MEDTRQVNGTETADYSLEIYKQRYETFRHLDRLRWQMLQYAIAGGSIGLGLTVSATGGYRNISLVAIGSLLILIAFVMDRIGQAIVKNGIVLRQFGERVGDNDIPQPQLGEKSYAFWVAVLLGAVGLFCVVTGVGTHFEFWSGHA